MRRSLITLLPLFAIIGFVPDAKSAIEYTVTDIGTLGGTKSYGLGINAFGQVVGYAYLRGDSTYHAFIYDGAIHDLGTLGGSDSAATGINDSGTVVGDSNISSSSIKHAFLYDGTLHDLQTLSGANSAALAINNRGQIVGRSQVTSGGTHAFVYDGTMHDLALGPPLTSQTTEAKSINENGIITGDTGVSAPIAFRDDGTLTELGTLGGTFSIGSSINNSGEIVGWSEDSDLVTTHAFIYDGVMHDLGTLGPPATSWSQAFAINSNGVVTGDSIARGDSTAHAFLYSPSMGMVDLNSQIDAHSGWILETGSAINGTGKITGIGLINGQDHAFLLTPVPEPSSCLLAGLGFVVNLAVFAPALKVRSLPSTCQSLRLRTCEAKRARSI